jgi:D-alanyl-D-alanine carboxypeptidase
MYLECEDIVLAGRDLYDRELRLSKHTSTAWLEMRLAAERDGLDLRAVSGFRSVQRQMQILLRKARMGQAMVDTLKVNAVPGYSQHHSGCALDLTDAANYDDPLREESEEQPVFNWLTVNAATFGFRLEHTRDNIYGFVYEPWHWFLSGVPNCMIANW